MEPKTTNREAQLIPDRHPQHDLFICDVADAVLKDVMPQMEHPFYSLSKKPETRVREYRNGPHWLRITPSVKGLATIYDKDILIYCISQMMHKIKNGEPVARRVHLNSRELLIFTNRGTSGRDYSALIESLDRLEGTRIRTNVRTGSEEQTDGFGLIDSSSVRRTHGLDGRLLSCEITLSEWLFNAVRAQEVLTLHRDYFRLRKPIERRLYEIARKHCGQQDEWKIGLVLLLKKTGAQSPEKRFRQMVKDLAKHDHLPDYRVEFDPARDMVIFKNRNAARLAALPLWSGKLDPDAFQEVRKVAPGWDVYYLEGEWRDWLAEHDITPNQPERHYLKFCATWFEKRGRPK
jgi:plasmid replication initiation protein